VKRILPIILTILVAGLTAAAVALASPAIKVGTLFAGTTAHKHYSLSVAAKCSVKSCSKTANEVLITVTAGSRSNKSDPCMFAGYGLPLTKISGGTFSGKQSFIEPNGPSISFLVKGKFTSATKLSGTVVGSKSCGGTDTFKLTGKVVRAPSGPTA
jgi:hypothetical protein